MILKEVYRCPYCAGDDAGVISIDLNALESLREIKSCCREFGDCEDSSQNIFVSNPKGDIHRPCRHLVSHILDAEVGRLLGNGGLVNVQSVFTWNWDCGWFRAKDPEGNINCHLWAELDAGGEDSFDPVSAHLSDKAYLEADLPSGKWDVRVSGSLIFARQPEKFLFELQVAFLESQGMPLTGVEAPRWTPDL